MIDIAGRIYAADMETVTPYPLRPKVAPADGLDRETKAWGRRVRQWIAALWCRRLHRRHHRRSSGNGGQTKVHCACCGRKFIRTREWRQCGHNVF